MRVFTVPSGTAPMRLDVFLGRHAMLGARRTVQRVVAAGTVRVNGRRPRKGDALQAGDVVEVPEELFTAPPLCPNPELAVAVLYEDAAVVAIDKPAGMPSHALRTDETGTIANFLLARYPELAHVGKHAREPGIVHRLDTDTSGVLLAARTPAAYGALRAQFSAHRVTKEYVALARGDIAAPGEVNLPIAHDRHNRRKMRVCSVPAAVTHARPALTAYRPIERVGGYTMLHLEMRTGVRHQIRVHLAAIGHPIVGDHLYGSVTTGIGAPRQLLHAVRVLFTHPVSAQPLAISAPLPADLTACLAQIRGGGRAAF